MVNGIQKVKGQRTGSEAEEVGRERKRGAMHFGTLTCQSISTNTDFRTKYYLNQNTIPMQVGTICFSKF